MRDDFLTTLRFWSDRGVDGFRVDVAHALTKDLTEPLLSQGRAAARPRGTDGSPTARTRSGTATRSTRSTPNGARCSTSTTRRAPPSPRPGSRATRRARYASPDGLGQAFNFDLLQADFDADEFREIITHNLAEAAESGASSTWVFSNHDVVRHATRYGLPEGGGKHAQGQDGKGWLLAGGPRRGLDVELGLRRARAATLLMLALPGSAYLYQGEELGLHEVAEIPDAERQDPTFFRNPGVDIGRDGCRVPLPWAAGGHLVRLRRRRRAPAAAGLVRRYAVAAQDGVDGSTLELYRTRPGLRRELQTAEELQWQAPGSADVLHFSRPAAGSR